MSDIIDELPDFEDFEDSLTASQLPPTHAPDIMLLKHIPVCVTLEVASTELSLGDILNAAKGDIIELDKASGEPLDIKVNGQLLGHGEVVMVNDKYGIRINDIASDDNAD